VEKRPGATILEQPGVNEVERGVGVDEMVASAEQFEQIASVASVEQVELAELAESDEMG
jgi:hypothetical protein